MGVKYDLVKEKLTSVHCRWPRRSVRAPDGRTFLDLGFRPIERDVAVSRRRSLIPRESNTAMNAVAAPGKAVSPNGKRAYHRQRIQRIPLRDDGILSKPY